MWRDVAVVVSIVLLTWAIGYRLVSSDETTEERARRVLDEVNR